MSMALRPLNEVKVSWPELSLTILQIGVECDGLLGLQHWCRLFCFGFPLENSSIFVVVLEINTLNVGADLLGPDDG